MIRERLEIDFADGLVDEGKCDVAALVCEVNGRRTCVNLIVKTLKRLVRRDKLGKDRNQVEQDEHEETDRRHPMLFELGKHQLIL